MAWITLFGLFAAIIALAVSGYFLSATSLEEKLAHSERRVQVRMEDVASREALDLGREVPRITLPKEVTSAHKKFLLLIKQHALPKLSRTELGFLQEAEKLYVAVQYDTWQKIPNEDLSALSELNDPGFAQIYRSKAFSVVEARSVASSMASFPAVEQLAKIHALDKAGVKSASLEIITRPKVALERAVLAVTGLLFCGGVLVWICVFMSKKSGHLVPQGHPALPMSDTDSDRFADRSFQLLLSFIVLELLGAAIQAGHKIGESLNDALIAGACVVALVGLSYLADGGRRITLRAIGWTKLNLGRNVLWGLGGALANVPLLVLLLFVSRLLFFWLPDRPHPVSVEITGPHSLSTLILVIIAASIFAPIFEESLFRGMIFPALSTRFKSVVAGVLVSSLLFAAMHPTGPPEWLPLAGIGAMSAYLSYQTKSLVPSVVMHATHNLVSLLLALALS
jgi:hypothetical protein